MAGQAETVVMLLAGGAGSRLNILGQSRAKPAIPFAGMYRIIDFTLSNVMSSGLTNIGILTQYKPYSLMAHIGTGISWDFIGPNREARILPPHTGATEHDWYRGTADAVWQNWRYIEGFNSREVLILSGDHIYSMDYARMLAEHRAHDAALTLAVMPINASECRHFGMVHVDKSNNVVRFEEKPVKSETNLASMGIYIFSTPILRQELERSRAHGGLDFGKDVIPGMLGQQKIHAYRFKGYWRDVGTIHAYWDAHMDLFRPESGLKIDDWDVYTNSDDRFFQDRPPARILGQAALEDALVSRGCSVNGTVKKSILSPGVIVEEGAVVRRSIILHDTRIEKGAVVDFAIVDKDVVIGPGARIGHGREKTPNQMHPTHLDTGITLVGKGAYIPAKVTVGRNCIIRAKARQNDFKSNDVPTGETL